MHPDEPFVKALSVMHKRGFRHLPVVEHGRPLGVVSARDALDDDLIDTILATNVRGAFAAVRAFRPLLDKSSLPGGGVVVNISSTAAEIAMGSNIMYCASKAALDNMTKSLARALAPRIRVVSVSPGFVDTNFVKSLDKAIEVQSEYAKTAYEDYTAQVTKLGQLYSELAKEAFRPYEGLALNR